MTIITALSDLHGCLPKINKPFDLMLICGDVCPVNEPHTFKLQDDFMLNRFASWVKSLPFKDKQSKVVMVFGNHDFFERTPFMRILEYQTAASNRLVIIEDSAYVFENSEARISIYGTPWCKQFGKWAYMRGDEDLRKKYAGIMNADIIISHDAADINGMGVINDGKWKGENAGNKILAERILALKPKYYFCGHIHTGTHTLTDIGGTKMANVSYLDESYMPQYYSTDQLLRFCWETGEIL